MAQSKEEFLAELGEALAPLGKEERLKTIQYYDELIGDRCEESMTEEKAVAQAGDVREIAGELLAGIAEPSKQGARRVWLTIIASPLLLVGAAVALALAASGWAIIVSFWACVAAFFAGFVGGIIQAAITGGASALFFVGAGLMCGGLGLVCVWPMAKLTALGAKATGGGAAYAWKVLFGRDGQTKKAEY